MPEVSVLIPYYNDEDFLKESIESVLNQTYKDFELILINHACTDSSREIAHSFTDNRIVHIDLPTNAGAGGGIIFKTFLNNAKGKFLKMFCADDVMHENFLETFIKYFKDNPNIDICFSDMNFIDKKGKFSNQKWYKYRNFELQKITQTDILEAYFHGNSVLPLPASMLRKKIADKIEIDYTLIMEFDVLLWIRLMAAGGKVGFIKDSLVDYRIHDGQTSSSAHTIKSFTQSLFEHEIILDEFMKIMDLHLFEAICHNPIRFGLDRIIKDDNDKFLAKYLYARFLLTIVNNFLYQRCGYKYLHSLFQNEESREILINKFNYTIKDFRNDYSMIDLSLNSDLLTTLYSNNANSVYSVRFRRLVREIIKRIVRKFFPKQNHLNPL